MHISIYLLAITNNNQLQQEKEKIILQSNNRKEEWKGGDKRSDAKKNRTEKTVYTLTNKSIIVSVDDCLEWIIAE